MIPTNRLEQISLSEFIPIKVTLQQRKALNPLW